MQGRAVSHYDVVAAVGGRVPDRLVLAHEQDGDAGGQAPEGRGVERGGVGGGERSDGGEGLMGSIG